MGFPTASDASTLKDRRRTRFGIARALARHSRQELAALALRSPLGLWGSVLGFLAVATKPVSSAGQFLERLGFAGSAYGSLINGFEILVAAGLRR